MPYSFLFCYTFQLHLLLQPQEVEPTPRSDRITHDFSKEYPEVEVESRKLLNPPAKRQSVNMETVKLNEEVNMLRNPLNTVITFTLSPWELKSKNSFQIFS